MNDLEKYFRQNQQRLIHKWVHYFAIYDRYFSKYRNRDVTILEIGVSQGGSLQMWKDYFGPRARIYGIDINPKCKELEEENIQIFIGSQSDRGFLRDLREKIPPVDILIDDGGHKMQQQIVSFEELFDIVKDDGIYLCEDTHTSYRLRDGGGHKRRGTFIEYSKNLVDYINAYHSTQKSLRVNKFTKSIDAIHYYDSVVVFEKRKRERPYSEKTGHDSFHTDVRDPKISAVSRFKMVVMETINKSLRFFRLPSFRWR